MSLPEAAGSLLSALILTYNEEANIKRTLDHLRWLDSIVVIDSGSSDATLSILAEHAAVRVLHRPFDSFADQCNFGLDQITTPWVLSLDADYRIPPSLASEIQTAIRDPANTGWQVDVAVSCSKMASLDSLLSINDRRDYLQRGRQILLKLRDAGRLQANQDWIGWFDQALDALQ